MSIFRRHRIGRRQSEQLLDGAAVPPGFDDLAGLFAAARGTQPADAGPDGELPGERAAVAAFRAAFDGTTEVLASGVGAPSSRRPGPLPAGTAPEENSPVRTLALRRMLAVKVLAAGALTVGLGGVAMAATGVPFVPGGGHRSSAAPVMTVTPGGSATARPTASGKDGDNGKDGDKADPSKSGRPTALRPGLDDRAALLIDCRAWLADHPKPAATPSQNQSGRRYDDLVKAAGGADKVAAYCAVLVKICPTFAPGSGSGADGTHGYVPGCPKPQHPTGTRTVPTKSHPEPTHTSVPPVKTTKPVPGGHGSGRPTTLPPMP